MTRRWAYWALFLLFAVILAAGRQMYMAIAGSPPNGLCVQTTGLANTEVWITLPGHHFLGSPVFSPDGEWIAFDAYKSGMRRVVSEVWVVRRDGTGARRLTTGATPRWHPDGTRLILMREQRNDDDASPLGIIAIDSDGRNEEFICRGRWPDWSPDGTRIVFSDGTGDTLRGGVVDGYQVFIAQADGSERKALAGGDCPSWSPDGTRIAFCSPGSGRTAPAIHVIDLESGSRQLVGYGWFRANWNRGGTELVCNGYADGDRPEMISIAVGATPETKGLPGQVEHAMSPSYSSDGSSLVFAAPH